MNRRVCHACVGLPRSFFCNVCDRTPEPDEHMVEKYQILNDRYHPCWQDVNNKAEYERALQSGWRGRKLIWAY